MRIDLYQEMYHQEEYYWWHVGKRKLILSLLNQFLKGKSELKLADMGCGTGKMLEELEKFGQAWGFDSSPKALSFCRQRGHKYLSKVDVSRTLPLKDNSFDAALVLDVLEHLKDDNASISEFHRVLARGGILVVTVPAYQFLWSYWDKMLGHQRRYNKKNLVLKLEKGGFVVQKICYYNALVFPMAFIFRFFKGIFQRDSQNPGSDFISLPSYLNNFLLFLSGIERFFIQKAGLPFGLSLICIAKKE